jgi:hypothetical protein
LSPFINISHDRFSRIKLGLPCRKSAGLQVG